MKQQGSSTPKEVKGRCKERSEIGDGRKGEFCGVWEVLGGMGGLGGARDDGVGSEMWEFRDEWPGEILIASVDWEKNGWDILEGGYHYGFGRRGDSMSR